MKQGINRLLPRVLGFHRQGFHFFPLLGRGPAVLKGQAQETGQLKPGFLLLAGKGEPRQEAQPRGQAAQQAQPDPGPPAAIASPLPSLAPGPSHAESIHAISPDNECNGG